MELAVQMYVLRALRARYALKVVPKSCRSMPDAFAISQLAIFEGILPRHRVIGALLRQPLAMS